MGVQSPGLVLLCSSKVALLTGSAAKYRRAVIPVERSVMSAFVPRRLTWVAVAAAIVVAAYGASGAGATAAAKNYTIGVAGALTGPIAPFDQPALKGFRLAVDEINAKGGLLGEKIVLKIKDTRSEASQSAVVAQELLNSNIDLLIVPCDGDLAIAA